MDVLTISIGVYEIYQYLSFLTQKEEFEKTLSKHTVIVDALDFINETHEWKNNEYYILDNQSSYFTNDQETIFLDKLKDISSSRIKMFHYPIYSIYSLLFCNQLYFFYPPNTCFIHKASNNLVNKSIVIGCLVVIFPMNILVLYGALFGVIYRSQR